MEGCPLSADVGQRSPSDSIEADSVTFRVDMPGGPLADMTIGSDPFVGICTTFDARGPRPAVRAFGTLLFAVVCYGIAFAGYEGVFAGDSKAAMLNYVWPVTALMGLWFSYMAIFFLRISLRPWHHSITVHDRGFVLTGGAPRLEIDWQDVVSIRQVRNPIVGGVVRVEVDLRPILASSAQTSRTVRIETYLISVPSGALVSIMEATRQSALAAGGRG
jgi:hypothetical protein